MKNRMLTVLHIVIWVAGTAFLITGSFHGNLWFDETYSAGIINHNLFDIIRISSGDVHPPFYYILLKLYTAVLGRSLLSLRLFSVLFASLLAGLGFTHLRRDFGEKLGFLYTTLMFLFAVTFKYANEIRMYTLAPYLVTLMAIYAYRYYKSGFADKKSGILFLVFGILGAYTHYYAFAAAGAVNLLLLLHCKKSGMLNIWKKTAVIQLAAYIPGFYFLLTQTTRVVGGFWISMRYPDFVLNSLSFFMIGDVPEDAVGLTEVSAIVFNALAFVFWSVCVFYYIRYYKKNPQKSEPAALTLKVLAIIIMFYFAVSLIRPLYYVRYLTVLSGLIVFFLAFAIDRISKPIIRAALLTLITVVLVLRVVPLYSNYYSPDNARLDSFVSEHVRENDIIVSDNIGLIAVLAVKYPDIDMYFYNRDHWTVEKAYEAYMPQLKTVRDLDEVLEHEGRVWVLKNYFLGSITEYILENSDKEVAEHYETFVLPYHNLEFGFTLME